MDYNYHTHTYLCMHATGGMEHYVMRAIEGGIKYMGFSGHIPFETASGRHSNFRIHPLTMNYYVTEFNRLKEKYKDKIDLKMGFEMEYYPKDFDRMFKSALDYGAEYLILGEHFLADESDRKNNSYTGEADGEEALITYANNVVDAIKTGVFTYVAHPDLIGFAGSEEIYKREMMKIIRASEESGIPLELNFLGIRDKRHYPKNYFWELVGTTNAPVTFGLDSHTFPDAYDPDSLKVALEMVDKYNLNYIGKPNLIEIQKKN